MVVVMDRESNKRACVCVRVSLSATARDTCVTETTAQTTLPLSLIMCPLSHPITCVPTCDLRANVPLRPKHKLVLVARLFPTIRVTFTRIRVL